MQGLVGQGAGSMDTTPAGLMEGSTQRRAVWINDLELNKFNVIMIARVSAHSRELTQSWM